jgi:hypothetical protein
LKERDLTIGERNKKLDKSKEERRKKICRYHEFA